MDYIQLNQENLEQEHICCAISNNKDPQVAAKKAWLRDRLDEGLVFLKSTERGKCFIEYIPAEFAWVPLEAEGYLYIDCFWVSGAFKGHGYANDLLEHCIADAKAKGKHGICVISSPKKQAFLSDPKYLAHKGFRVADTAEPFFTLLYLPLAETAPMPRFKPCAKVPHIEGNGFILYYTAGCPYTAKYVPLIEKAAKDAGIPFKSILLANRNQAQNAPAAWTNYALFYNGAYVGNEILSEKKFLALAAEKQQ
ncbi:MAG: N-acetyltransferase [Faecalibacterium sp.]|jgi:predicted GNAT family acetyltransferase|nr:N-acetyltransferase [Faecalibacterium sp.]